jgi:NAD(P)-dependent dehydrogenase (short-subunit alcohol dehydrogenase family)
VAVAAGVELTRLLSSSFGEVPGLVTFPSRPARSAADFDRWIQDVGDVRAVVVEGVGPHPAPPAAPCDELLGLRALAQLTRVAARRMVARRSGTIVCAVRHPASAELPRTALCEATAGFVRSAASELAHYGVSIYGVVIGVDREPLAERDIRPGAAAPVAAAARLARILTTRTGTDVASEVYLVTSAELGRLAPPSVDRELVRSDRRIRTAEAVTALARWLDPARPPPSAPPGPGPAGIVAGRVAIVTGGGGGIGRAAAIGLASDGAAVVVADLGCDADGAGRDPGPARAVAAEIVARGGRALAVCADVSRPEECDDLVARTIHRFGRLDALCHAAGVVRQALVFEFTDEEWDSVFGVHVLGARNMVRSSLPPMRGRGYGRVVLFSSRSVTGSPGQAGYAAAKGTILGFGRSLAGQLAGSGICVNTVFPSGRTRASMPGVVSNRRRRIELLRARHHGITDPVAFRSSPEQDPENNAAAISWLCSEQAGAVTGRIFGTGGWRVDLYRPTAVAKSIAPPGILTAEDVRTLSTGRGDG